MMVPQSGPKVAQKWPVSGPNPNVLHHLDRVEVGGLGVHLYRNRMRARGGRRWHAPHGPVFRMHRVRGHGEGQVLVRVLVVRECVGWWLERVLVE